MNDSATYLQAFFLRKNLSKALDLSGELSRFGGPFEYTEFSSSHCDKMLSLVDSFMAVIGSIIGERSSDEEGLDCRDLLSNKLAINLCYVYEVSMTLKDLLHELNMRPGTSAKKQVQLQKEVGNKIRAIKKVVTEFDDQAENMDTLPIGNDKSLLN